MQKYQNFEAVLHSIAGFFFKNRRDRNLVSDGVLAFSMNKVID